MRSFQKKRGWRDIMESKPVLALLGILIICFAWSIFGLWTKMKDTRRNEIIAEEKVAALRLQKEKFSADIRNLETEAGKERVFRENYGLAKEGEDVIVIIEDKNAPRAAVEDSGGFFSFLKRWFK